MKIYTFCAKCNGTIYLHSSAASTRPDLQMEKGTELEVCCKKCGNKEKKHVNDFRAKANNKIILIGIIIGILTTFILWSFYGAISSVSFVIPIIFWQQQMKATKAFNSYLVRRKMPRIDK